MNLLDRYIFRNVLLTAFAAVGLFGFLLALGNTIKDLLPYILSGLFPASTTIELILLLIPFVVSYALPMGVLCGVLLVLGRLSADSEVTAMRAAGLSVVRIARPVLIVGALGALATLYINFQSMPWARVEYDRLLIDAVRARPLDRIIPKTYIRDFPGFVVYVGAREGELLRDVLVHELDREGRSINVYTAAEGRAHFSVESNELVVTLREARVEHRDPNNPELFQKAPNIFQFREVTTIALSLDRLLGRAVYRKKLQWSTWSELRAERARVAALPEDPAQPGQKQLELLKISLTVHEKINIALAVLSFAVIGVPLGITVSRRETSANLGLATLLALGYYLLTTMVGWLDQRPELRPDLLLWLPNLIFLSLGVWLFRRSDRC